MPSRDRLDAAENLGVAARSAKNGDLEHAILHLKSVIASGQHREVAHGMLAAIYAQLGMTAQAKEHYQTVLTLNPQNPLARFQLGLIQLMAKQPQEALETWKPALRKVDDYMVQFHSGLALLELERPSEARSAFEKVAAHMPKKHPLYPETQRLLDTLKN